MKINPNITKLLPMETNRKIDKQLRLYKLERSFCPPHRYDNRKTPCKIRRRKKAYQLRLRRNKQIIY